MTSYGPFILFEIVNLLGISLGVGVSFMLILFLLSNEVGRSCAVARSVTQTLITTAAIGLCLAIVGEVGLYWFLFGPGSPAVMTFVPLATYVRWGFLGIIALSLVLSLTMQRPLIKQAAAALALSSWFMVILILKLSSAIPKASTWIVWWCVFSGLLTLAVVAAGYLNRGSQATTQPVDESNPKST